MRTKRIVALALSLILSLGVFAGCNNGSGGGTAVSDIGTPAASTDAGGDDTAASGGNAEPPSGDVVTLTYYGNPITDNDYTLMIEAFEAEYPNIKIQYVELPSETNKKSQTLSTVLQAQDSSMDVFMIDTTWPLMFSSAGWVEPLDDVVSDADKARYLEGPISANTGFDGKLYSLPMYIDAGILVYRKDLLDKYGFEPPTTWDELAEQSKAIMEGEEEITAGFTSAWKQYEALVCCALEFIWDYGGDVLDDAGNVVINSPEAAAGLQRMYDLMYTDQITETGISGYQWTDSRAVFNAGAVVFQRDWPDAYTSALDPNASTVSDQVAFARLPSGPSGSYTTLGGWSIAVSAFSEHKDEAKLFAKFMCDYEASKIYTKIRGKIPALTELFDDPEILEEVPRIPELYTMAETGRPRPKTAYYEELSSVLQQGFGSILADTMTVQEALDYMEPLIEEIMNR